MEGHTNKKEPLQQCNDIQLMPKEIVRLLKVLCVIAAIIMVIGEIAEFLFVPALCVLAGVLNGYPWQFYVISIGAYFVFLGLGELIISLICRAIDKKYTPFFKRQMEGIINFVFKKKNEDEQLPMIQE